MCPGILTIACAIDGGIVFVLLVIIDRRIDVHLAIEGATAVVVTTIDSGAVATNEGVATVPVYVRLIDIARIFVIQTIGTTENLLATEGGTLRNIYHGTSGDTLLITTAIDGLEVSAEQIDNGRSLIWDPFDVFVFIILMVNQKNRIHTHTYTTTLSSAKYFCILECCHGLRHVNEDIAAVLHQVLLFLSEITLTSTIDLLDGIERVVGVVRTEVNKGISQERLVVAGLGVTVFVEVCTEVLILIVIDTVCTTKDFLYTSLNIFRIC